MLHSLQFLRAIAAWMVVLHHVAEVFFRVDYSTAFGVFVDKGAFGVDIFFVICGVVMYLSTHRSERSWIDFIFHRVKRIVPAYWLWTLSFTLLMFLFPAIFTYSGFSAASLMASLFFFPYPNVAGRTFCPVLTVGWTLYFEVIFYLFVSFSLFVAEKRRMLFIFACLLAVYLLSFFGYTSPFWATFRVFEFFAGLQIAKYYQRGFFEKWSMRGSILLLSAGVLILVFRRYDASWAIAAVAIVAAFISMEKKVSWNPIFLKSGSESYSVYLCHYPLLELFYFFSTKWGIAPLLSIALALVAVTLTGKFSHKIIESRFGEWLQQEYAKKSESRAN